MKNRIKNTLIIVIGLILIASMLFSGENLTTSNIKTSAQCDMCKDRIETHLNKIEGIEKATLVVDSAVCIVTYNIALIKLDEIKQEISSIGYDADEVQANKRAYKKLPKCCKKPEDR